MREAPHGDNLLGNQQNMRNSREGIIGMMTIDHIPEKKEKEPGMIVATEREAYGAKLLLEELSLSYLGEKRREGHLIVQKRRTLDKSYL